jgi:tetratricopeptide (TPR) repeat protein
MQFVKAAALTVKMYRDQPMGITRASESTEDDVAPFAHLLGADKQAVDAVRETPYDPATTHRAFETLRRNGRLAEIDLLYTLAPQAVRSNHAVMSVWCSIPRILRDGSEQLRRAEEMRRLYPDDSKSLNHMIFAVHATKGFEETMHHVKKWMVEYPDDIDILGPAANIALSSEQYAVAEEIYQKLKSVQRGGLEAGSYRLLIIALERQNKTEEAEWTSEEALCKYPGSDVLVSL